MKPRFGAMLLTALLWIALACAVTAQQGQAAPLPGQAGPAAVASSYTIISETVPYTTPILIDDPRPEYLKTCFNIRTLTIYRPVQDGTPLDNRPVVFFVHGGSWTDRYASQHRFVSRSFSGELGWITVIIDYRLTADEVTLAENCPAAAPLLTATKAAWYPDNIQDVAAALRWTVDHIEEYGGNPDQIALFGHSAGGHLASLLATHSRYADLRPAIKGVVSLSGAYSVPDLADLFDEAINQTWRGGITDTAALEEGSPTTYVTTGANLPPFYLLHCQWDLPSLPEQAVLFKNRLDLLGFSVQHDYLLGYNHLSEITATAFITATPTILIADFMESVFWPYRVYLPLTARQAP